MNLGLEGSTALITGAASGIGRATVQVMAAEGARIILVDRDKDGLAETAAGMPAVAGGMTHIMVTADLSTAEGVAAAMREALAAADVDILVSNAGVCQFRPFSTLTDADWQATISVNLMASVRAVRHVLPGMRERGRGSIVFTASDLARQPEISCPDYQVSKTALVSLMKTLALDAAPHVRVNAVAPGPVWTALWSRPGGIADDLAHKHGLPREQAVERELSLRQLPLGRIGQPHEIARVIAFLASGAASFVTGSVWGVDGGSIRGLL